MLGVACDVSSLLFAADVNRESIQLVLRKLCLLKPQPSEDFAGLLGQTNCDFRMPLKFMNMHNESAGILISIKMQCFKLG